jgi:hypothetical protein
MFKSISARLTLEAAAAIERWAKREEDQLIERGQEK